MTRPEQVLRRYYIGLAVIAVGVLTITLTITALSWGQRTDRLTRYRISQAYQSIRNYSQSHQTLPSSLNVLGSTFEGVQYQKITESIYMLCASFKTVRDERPGYTSSTYYPKVGSSVEVDLEIGKLKLQDSFTNYTYLPPYDSYYSHQTGRNCFLTQDPNIQRNYTDQLQLRTIPLTD